MKALSLIIYLLFAGCSLPSKTYHGVRMSARRASAVAREDIASHVVVTCQSSKLTNSISSERVVCIARDAGGTPGRPIEFAADERQLTESLLIEGMLSKKYRGASRLNLKPVELEMLFGYGRVNAEALRQLFKGRLILLCTVTRIETSPEKYTWRHLLSGDEESQIIGTRVNLYLTAELLDAETTETLFIATASMDAVLRDANVSRSTLIAESVRKAMATLPERP